MKYDVSKRRTMGAKRTLEAFRGAMFATLVEKPFESISASELCERAGYPRATFYNYFDDKFDLLDYCWQWLAERVGLTDYEYAPHKRMLYRFFDRIFDYTDEHLNQIRAILAKNPEAGYMFGSFRTFVDNCMRGVFADCPDAEGKPVPRELLAAHYSASLFLVWQWRYLRGPACTKDEAREYLRFLLDKL